MIRKNSTIENTSARGTIYLKEVTKDSKNQRKAFFAFQSYLEIIHKVSDQIGRRIHSREFLATEWAILKVLKTSFAESISTLGMIHWFHKGRETNRAKQGFVDRIFLHVVIHFPFLVLHPPKYSK